jgi:hypothetical protein
MSWRHIGLLSGLVVIIGVMGCGASLDPSGEPVVDDGVEDPLPPADDELMPNMNDRESIDLARDAIVVGLTMGKGLVTDGVNTELARHDIDFDYIGGEAMTEIPDDAISACPYVENRANSGATAMSCRLLVEMARDTAYVSESDVHASEALGSEFDEDRAVNEHWFYNGLTSGIEGEYLMAVRRLREARVCDQEPAPIESSREQGVAVGREMFEGVLAEQVAATPITQCDIDGGIVRPALARARGMVESTFTSRPLCDGYEPTDMDDRAEFHQARNEYYRGIGDGVEEGAIIGSEQLFRTWVCQPPAAPPGGGTGDPLVLDLDDDGVQLSGPANGVMFQLGDAVNRSGWVADAGDGLLAIDHNGNGVIDDGSELFGDRSWTPEGLTEANGLLSLARYDRADLGGNNDGVIDQRDLVYSALVVWRDADLDGQTGAGELHGLSALGVASISLDYVESGAALTASFERADGSAGMAADVWLLQH